MIKSTLQGAHRVRRGRRFDVAGTRRLHSGPCLIKLISIGLLYRSGVVVGAGGGRAQIHFHRLLRQCLRPGSAISIWYRLRPSVDNNIWMARGESWVHHRVRALHVRPREPVLYVINRCSPGCYASRFEISTIYRHELERGRSPFRIHAEISADSLNRNGITSLACICFEISQ